MSILFRDPYRPVVNKLGGIRVQTSIQGLSIPIIYGRTRVAPNLVWYGDFFWKAINSGKKGLGGAGSGKKGGGEYDYGAAVVLGLCQGPIVRTGTVWSTQGNLPAQTTTETFVVPGGGGSYTVVNSANFLGNYGVTRGDSYSVSVNDYGSPGSITLTGTQQTPMIEGSVSAGHYTRSGSHSATYNFAAADVGKTMSITYSYSPPLTSGGVPQDPISTVGFTLFKGTQGQAVWSYLTTNHSSQAIGYTTLAYLATPVLDLGMGGVLPNMGFEVFGLLPFNGGPGDCNPSDVINDIFTNTIYGCGLISAELATWTGYSNYCIANGLFISPALESERTAAEWIREILNATNSEIVESGGLLYVLPYGDTSIVANGVQYTPATNPIYNLTADSFIRSGETPPIEITRPSVQDAYNSVRIEHLDRGNSYNPSLVEAQDLNAINRYKYRPEPTRQYHMFTTQPPAALAAQLALARLVYIRNRYKFKLPQSFILLDPMDLVTVPAQLLGMDATLPPVPIRMLTIDEQEDRSLECTAEEFPWGTAGTTLYPKQALIPGGPNANAPPGSVNAPIFFEALSRMNNGIGHTLWFGLSGNNPNWGGCRIWFSQDSVNYIQIGTTVGQCNMGVTANSFPFHADADSTNNLQVDLSMSFGKATTYTSVVTRFFAGLALVGGELISTTVATLTSAYHYTFSNLIRRGVYGTTIAAHSPGEQFLIMDDNVFGWDFNVEMLGMGLFWFKFTSFNQSGLVEELLANVTAYSYTLTGNAIGLLTPAHSSYRPTTNPLTAHDAGASVTINIAAFVFRVAGMPDVALAGAALTGKSYNTLYFVYVDDPGFLSPTSATGFQETYGSSTVQEDALNVAGRFFIGSITTPRSGAPDTKGNNDGGSGAQIGMVNILSPSIIGTATLAGSGTLTNPQNLIDGDQTTFAEFDAVADHVISHSAAIELSGPPGLTRRFATATLFVLYSVPTNSGTHGAFFAEYSYPDGAAFSAPFINIVGPTTSGIVLGSVALPFNINISQVTILLQVTQPNNAANLDETKARVYEVWIEVVE